MACAEARECLVKDRDSGCSVYLVPLCKAEWVVYAKRPFGGPEAVLAYLSRYTHRVVIANSRLIAYDQQRVTFKWKDYRIKGRDRYRSMPPTSSSAVSSSTCCQTACTASATTACR